MHAIAPNCMLDQHTPVTPSKKPLAWKITLLCCWPSTGCVLVQTADTSTYEQPLKSLVRHGGDDFLRTCPDPRIFGMLIVAAGIPRNKGILIYGHFPC